LGIFIHLSISSLRAFILNFWQVMDMYFCFRKYL
jgi:hypothetical protein